MKKTITIICASLLIVIGLYYLIAEFVCIVNSVAHFQAYYKNTISDLCVPYAMTGFSSSYWLMISAFLVVAPTFFICYNILFFKHLRRCKVICCLLSVMLLTGLLMVAFFNCESRVILHFIGAFLTFSSCNILALLTILFSDVFERSIKNFAIIVAISGIISSLLTILLKQSGLFPIFERLTVYPIIIFCLLTGVIFLRRSLMIKQSIKFQ